MSGFCPFVATFIKTVVEKAKIGICAGNINVIDASRGSLEIAEQDPTGDRFKIALPYAGQHVTWEVVFNSCYPTYPPEIILGPDDEEFTPDIQRLEGYCDWNYSDDKSLLLTLRELLAEYRRYHLSLLAGSRLEFDYNSLVDDSSECHSDDVEVYVSRKNGYCSGPVRFLIRLNIDFTGIPAYIMKDGPKGENMALLLVTYQNLDGGTVTPQLLFSPRIERLFNIFGGSRVLPFPHEGCLIDYVPAVREHLNKMIQAICGCFEKRKEYIASFIAHFGNQVVEYDLEGYNEITCLFEWQNFRFLVTVELSLRFPQEQPLFTFRSVYHTKTDGTPYSKVFSRYPYSPRWDSVEMAERARAFFLATVSSFQKDSIQESSN